MTVTPAQVRSLRSLNLRDEAVQTALAGYLSHHFGLFDAVVLHALQRFVTGIDSRRLDTETADYNAGRMSAPRKRQRFAK